MALLSCLFVISIRIALSLLWSLVPPQICGVGTLERGAFKEVIKVDEVVRVVS